MKAIKTTLVITVIVLISIGTKMWISDTGEIGKIILPQNPFTEKIEQEIELLKSKPDHTFCKEYYTEVNFHINDFYKQNRFGNTTSENDQWKENFDKSLYTTYTEKFIKQAFYVFQRSEWEIEKLKFIQKEVELLSKSSLLEKGSDVSKKFAKIELILNKYYEVVNIIAQNQKFSYTSTGLLDNFPIEEIKKRIADITLLKSNHLGNEYVNNCKCLHEQLKTIPHSLFRAHVRYLDQKIDKWSDFYRTSNSQIDYANTLYKPIRSEIDQLEDNIYQIESHSLSLEYNRLKKKWENDGDNAYRYFTSKKTN